MIVPHAIFDYEIGWGTILVALSNFYKLKINLEPKVLINQQQRILCSNWEKEYLYFQHFRMFK
jgi:hypothetical protein